MTVPRSVGDMTKNTSSHANCTHPATKSERAKCRRMMRAETTEQTTQRLLATAPIETAEERARKSAETAGMVELAEYQRLVAEIESRETDTLSDVQADIEKLRDVTSKMF